MVHIHRRLSEMNRQWDGTVVAWGLCCDTISAGIGKEREYNEYY